jgi:hypothetical protein
MPRPIVTVRALVARLAEATRTLRTRLGCADDLAQVLTYRALATCLYRCAPDYAPVPLPKVDDLRPVTDILDEADLAAVLRDFQRMYPGEELLLRFHELLLSEYDPAARKKHGVFTTPQPIAAYLARAVDELLQREFGLALGLADTTTWAEMTARIPRLVVPAGVAPGEPFVQILDPAVGSGAFLVAVIARVHERLVERWRDEDRSLLSCARLWNHYVTRHLLPRLHGYELMPASLAIAHLTIGMKLRETGYDLAPGEFTGITCTNALVRTPALSPAPTVILGNPPYAAVSANLTPECRAAVDPYRTIAGEPIRERGMLQFEKNLQDDYVKFFARAEQAVLRAGLGVVGFVTNHSFLDGPTLRGLRHHLATTFQRILVVDLHGGITKGERAPDGGPDENVFGIRQGIALSLLRRTPHMEPACVERLDLWGTRIQKYQQLHGAPHTAQAIPLEAPNFLFVAAPEADPIWESALPLTAVFVKYSTGTETGFDELLVDFERRALFEKVKAFSDGSATAAQLRRRYRIRGGHAEDLLARRATLDVQQRECRLLQIRPFDFRYAYLRKDLLKTNSFNVMTELSPAWPGLLATRQTKERFGVFVTPGFCGHKCISAYDRSYVFASRCGFTPEFLRHVELALGPVNATDLFHYIYAILSTPSYRERFGARLTREFPRVPITTNRALFAELARCGRNLVAAHLLTAPGKALSLTGAGPALVAPGYPRYEAARIYINPERWFTDIPSAVWNAHIGAYQVCAKWLKDRRGRILSRHDIADYGKILHALATTLTIATASAAAFTRHGGWTAFVSRADT